jgi:hypothetical protein
MDTDALYIPKVNLFLHKTGLSAYNFSSFLDVDNDMKSRFTLRIFGEAHSNSGGNAKFLIMESLDVTDCNDFGAKATRCYRGNILPVLRDYSLSEIERLNATSQDFLTAYQVPFYRLEIYETADHVTTPIRIYGCVKYALLFSAQDDEDHWLSGGTLRSWSWINHYRNWIFRHGV